VFDLVGEARRLAERDDRAAALATVGRTAWLEAWEEAVSSATDLMVDRANERIRLAAESVKMPARNREKMMVTERERRMLHARMGSSAAPMVKTLNQLESLGQRAAVGKSGDGMRVWQDALRTSARRLEGAWLALEDAAELESVRWEVAVREVAQWRRAMWPVWVTGLVAMAAAVWLGLVFGGYVASPEWLTMVWSVIGGG
jgi:hypothetical protein